MIYRHLPPGAILAMALAPALVGQRPAILGVAHISLKTNDLAAARNFYGRDLGLAEPFTRGPGLAEPFTRGPGLAVFKVNDRQYIELSADLASDADDRLANIAFETTGAKQLRDYLAGRGVGVPASVSPDRDGNLTLTVRDPEGRQVEFVQYLPGSRQGGGSGSFLPSTRISERIIHVGFVVRDQAAEDRFYKDILGFEEFWHGGRTDSETSWVDMRVPDGDDWLEYMLNVANPTPKTRGVMNHLALGVPDMRASYKTLTARGVNLRDQKPKIGRDGKWQLNLYDPNLTRAELMEPKPVETPCCSPMRARVRH
jgi:catechol 2,3-dioxygenase-like lactoylglutathione lyase family enzyme